MRGFSSTASLQRQTSSWAWPPCRITSPTEVPGREPGTYRHCASTWSTAVLGTYVSISLFLATPKFSFWVTGIWFRCRGRCYAVRMFAQSGNSDVGQSSTMHTVQFREVLWSLLKTGVVSTVVSIKRVRMLFILYIYADVNCLVQTVLVSLQRGRCSHHPDSSKSRSEQKNLWPGCKEADATAQFHTKEEAHLSCKLNGRELHGRESCCNLELAGFSSEFSPAQQTFSACS